MSRFPGKKLPPHWVYLPSRRQVRDLLRGLDADVRRVDFAGTGSGPSSVGLLIGYLERRVADGGWCFYLRLWGVPESSVEGRSEELALAALLSIEDSVAECLAIPATDVVKPTQLHLWFKIDAEGVIPECRVKPVAPYSFSAGQWWIRSDGDWPREWRSPRRLGNSQRT
ncbi:hypothetical protein TA3x_000134 [Tundrisphaera sp. TA3]|uniref:hypothetical protein n=1 Tax=Tundrisphaera sp. TA3 TaxID=3435775 RepID=UPI003EC0E514